MRMWTSSTWCARRGEFPRWWPCWRQLTSRCARVQGSGCGGPGVRAGDCCGGRVCVAGAGGGGAGQRGKRGRWPMPPTRSRAGACVLGVLGARAAGQGRAPSHMAGAQTVPGLPRADHAWRCGRAGPTSRGGRAAHACLQKRGEQEPDRGSAGAGRAHPGARQLPWRAGGAAWCRGRLGRPVDTPQLRPRCHAPPPPSSPLLRRCCAPRTWACTTRRWA